MATQYPGITCLTCGYLDLINPSSPICRRRTAMLIVVKPTNKNDDGVRKFWPVMNPGVDWCGEHRTREQIAEDFDARSTRKDH